jgi:hypothetical protein
MSFTLYPEDLSPWKASQDLSQTPLTVLGARKGSEQKREALTPVLTCALWCLWEEQRGWGEIRVGPRMRTGEIQGGPQRIWTP